MGNEMGNNNTSAIKEEDNIIEAEKKTNLEDTSDLAHGISQDVMEKASKASNDITNKLGKDTKQEDDHADDVKGKTQLVTTTEAKDEDAEGKAILFGSNHTTSTLENFSVEEDTHASDVNMENQMYSVVEAVQEKATGLASEDRTTELGKVTPQKDSHEDGVKEKIQVIPTAEAKDVQEIPTGQISNNIASILENGSLGGNSCEINKNMENQMHPTAETEDVQEKATGMAYDYLRSSLGNDSFEGDAHEDDVNVDHQKHQTAEGKDYQIAERLDFNDKTSECEDKKDGNVVIPIANGTDARGKITTSASDDPLNLSNAFEGAGDEITEASEPEKSQNAGSVEADGENYETLSSSSVEGTEEYEKHEEPYLGKDLSVTYNHHLHIEPSIKQDDEETMVLTLNTVNMSNDSDLQESSNVHSSRDEPVKFLSQKSFLGMESLLEENLVETNSNIQHTKDDVLEKEIEFHEILLSTDKSDAEDGNEFGRSLIGAVGATSDSPSIGNNPNGNALTVVNYTTEDSLNSLLESLVGDNPLMFDHEENCKVLYEESKLSRNRSTTENSHDYKPDQCAKDSLKEYKFGMVNAYEMTIESNGDCNGERNIVLDSSLSRIANIAQVEEHEVTENGLQFDANLNKASDESSVASEQKHPALSETETGFHIAGLTVIDCIHEEGETYKNKIEGKNEKPEASHVMVNTYEGTEEMSEQCNPDLVTINQEESFPLQNSSSLLHIYDYHQDNVKQTKSFTATSMPNSDWKHTNESKNFGTNIDNLDSLTVPSVDLVDDEASEKEGEDYSQHTEAASPAEAELTTSAATMSIEPFSNSSTFANGGYETRDSVTRFSTESNTDNPINSCQIQKSPSFNLNLRMETRLEESDQAPLLHQDKSASKSLENHTSYNLSNSMPHAEYEQCMSPSEEMAVEEKIVTMERSYSRKSKAPCIGLLKEEEEEAHLLVMQQTQDNHIGTKKIVKEMSSTSTKGTEKRKPRSYFFSSCMCCATVAN